MPVLQLDYSAPQIAIMPRDEKGKVQPQASVSVSLAGVMEVASSVDPSPLAMAVCTNGSWRATDGGTSPQTIGAGWQSFVYSCLLAINATSVTSNGTVNDNSSNSGSNVTLEVQFDLFNSTGSVSLGDSAAELVNLTVTPSFTKLSVRMRGQWPWQSADSRLLLRMAIDPTFTQALLIRTTTFNSSSMASETTWRLEGQKPAGGLKRSLATLVRLVNVVGMDGEWHVGDEWISHAFETNNASSSSSSALVLSFGQFKDSLTYDPDISVLLGRDRGGGDGDGEEENTGLIIGVVVAVFVALLVVAVIMVTVVAVHRYRRAMVARFYQRRRKAVNFAYYDET